MTTKKDHDDEKPSKKTAADPKEDETPKEPVHQMHQRIEREAVESEAKK